MRIVTTYHGIHQKMPIEKIIEMLFIAGFDGIDFTDIPTDSEVTQSSYKDYAKHLVNVAESFGISFTQSHAPISTALLKEFDGDTERAINRICRSIEFSSLLGVENVIIHPIQKTEYSTEPEKVFEENMTFMSKLASCAEQCGTKIAIENMIMPTLVGGHNRAGVCADPVEYKKYIDSLGSKAVTGCLDFGHSAIAGREPQDMLRVMGADYITATHIHDNDFLNDNHQLPGIMNMKWDEICKAMADIGYEGDFTLEAICFYSKLNEELLPEAFKFMYKTAKYFVDKIEKYKI